MHHRTANPKVEGSSFFDEPVIALDKTRNAFDENGVDLDFELSYAPLRKGKLKS